MNENSTEPPGSVRDSEEGAESAPTAEAIVEEEGAEPSSRSAEDPDDSEAADRPADQAETGDGEESALTADELEQEIAELEDRLLRKQADLINYRRRIKRERAEQTARVRGDVLRDLLPVLDDFERALEGEYDDVEGYREGVELILRSLEDLLQTYDVERLEPVGEGFDPSLHEAVERRTTGDVEAGCVVDVYQAGYRMGDRLLRPARVAVAVSPEEDGESSDEGVAGGDAG